MSSKYVALGFLLGLAFCWLVSWASDWLSFYDCVEWDHDEACEIAEKAGYEVP
jgi:hypothetical protein